MSDYEEYLDKYCKSHGILHEEGMAHAVVKEYKRWKEEEDDGAEGRIQPSKLEQKV